MSSGSVMHRFQRRLVFSSVFSGHLADSEDLGNRISADSVRAVNAAGHFTGCLKSRDRLTAAIHNLSVGVNCDAAHRVVHGHR